MLGRFVWLAIVLFTAEITVFIEVSHWLESWEILVLTFATSFMGVKVLRSTGLQAVASIQSASLAGPLAPNILAGILTLFGGFLLLFPGFVSDFMAAFLLIPPIKRAIVRKLLSRLNKKSSRYSRGFGDVRDNYIIDAEYHEVKPSSKIANDNPKQPKY